MQNNSKILSVVIPVFNRENTLATAVDSVLAVTSRDIELIIVDDGSTDNSGAICDEYAKKDERVKVFHKENGGVSSARNVGIDNANGKYVYFCDSDDFVYSEVLEKYLNFIADSDIDLIMFGYEYNRVVNESSDVQKLYLPENKIMGKSEIVDLIIKPLTLHAGTGLVPLWHKLFLRETIKRNKIRFEENVHRGEDWRFVLDFADIAESAYYIPEVVYQYILDGTQSESKYDVVAGYHLLGSERRKLFLCSKYGFDLSMKKRAVICHSILLDVVFAVANRAKKDEIKSMLKDDIVRNACSFFIKLKKSDYFNYEISRKCRLYAYLILSKNLCLLKLFIKHNKKQEEINV